MNSNRWFLHVCLGILAAGTGLLIALNQDWFEEEVDSPIVQQDERQQQVAEQERLANQLTNRQALAKALDIAEDELQDVGGVLRPKRDMAFDSPVDETSALSRKAPSVVSAIPAPDAGTAPRLNGDENEQVAGLIAELTAEQPVKEAMSSYFREAKFDREAYAINPDEYLNKFRPGRAFSPADPSADVSPLVSMSPGFQNVLQGEQVVFRVQASAGMPVTFHSPQTGHFLANQLSTLTVAANDKGIATATYKTGRGSLGLTDVVVASPVHSGQIQYRINVELPEGNAVSNRP